MCCALGAKKWDIMLSETLASNAGLGHMMLSAQAAFQVPLVFACLVALAVLGTAIHALMA